MRSVKIKNLLSKTGKMSSVKLKNPLSKMENPLGKMGNPLSRNELSAL
jgi:hypothetical protein